ncbi:MAG: O-antigen ligase family protein, partial [Planctomycetales bacterium]|nr:O-antigen ligase family protein [Planctomycetales bacterium]
MGGRQASGRLAYLILFGLAAVVWCWLGRHSFGAITRRLTTGKHGTPTTRERRVTDRSQVRMPLVTVWVLGLALVGLQIVPLPAPILNRLSPNLTKDLPIWDTPAGAEMGLDGWRTISLSPVETQRGLVLLLGYGMLFLVVVRRLKGWNDIRDLMRLLALAGVVMALIGISQRFLGNGKYLWVYSHPFRTPDNAVKGPFINQNHFGSFLALTLAPLLYLWCFQPVGPHGVRVAGTRPRGWTSPVVGLGLVSVAALLTFSRGAALTVGVAAAVFLVLAWRGSLLGRRGPGLSGWLLLGVVVLTLSVYGAEPLRRQLRTLTGDMSQMSSARAELWHALGKATPKFLLVGSGVGTHREVYPQYLPTQYAVELTHAENGYLQVLLETGAIGLLLLLTGWAIVVRSAWKVYCHAPAREARAMGAVCLAGAGASLFHSMADFVWYIPACMTLTVLLAAAAVRGSQLVADGHEPASQQPAALLGKVVTGRLAGVAALAATVWMVAVALPPARAGRHWDRYLAMAVAADKLAPTITDVTLLKTLASHLEQAVAADPDFARSRLRLASTRLRLFEQLQREAENPMPLAHLREAAASSRDAFGSIDAQRQWLRRAVGDNLNNAEEALRHATAALRLCPLQGDAYVLLAELEMLSRLDTYREPLLQQALRVRPYSGSVLFAVGAHFAFKQDEARAIRFWRAAFHRAPDIRKILTDTLTPQVTARQFVESMRPTVEMLDVVRVAYARQQKVNDAQWVATQIGLAEERAARAGDVAHWKGAQRAWHDAGDPARSALCGFEALKLEPSDFEVRKTLATALLVAGQPAPARDHLEWCRRRRPHDEEVQALYERLR